MSPVSEKRQIHQLCLHKTRVVIPTGSPLPRFFFFFFEQGVQTRLGGLTASKRTQVPTYLALFLRLRSDLGTRLVLTQIIYMYLETPLCINF